MPLGFSYDFYTKTSAENHKDFVTEFHKKLYDGGFVYAKTVAQAFCQDCNRSLTDRMVAGHCPFCGENARGDQCDACGKPLEPGEIRAPRCAKCGGDSLSFADTTQLFLALSRLQDAIAAFADARPFWRKNAAAFTKRYLDEGLIDRAITRDLDWGIAVPKAGFEEKKIYIWAENVLGYLSASKALCDEKNLPFETLWGENARHYYVHGKDNIPFHTVILPGLLLAHGGGFRLPDYIISGEHMTLEGRKISTSRNWAVWAKDMAQRFHPDALRYFFIANGPEKRDANFSFREFAAQNNSELVGVFGNFVHRTLAFIEKYGEITVPSGEILVSAAIEPVFSQAGGLPAEGRLKEALSAVLDLARFGNRYFDAEAPWKTRTDSPEACGETLFNCVQMIANLAVLLAPFLPFSAAVLRGWLGVSADWKPQFVPAGRILPPVSPLFQRIEP